MEAPGPPAVRARSRRGGPSAPQRHTRGAGALSVRNCRISVEIKVTSFPQSFIIQVIADCSEEHGLEVDIGDDSYSNPGEVVQCCKTTTQHCREAEDLCSSFNLDVAEDSVITCNQVISMSFKT